MHEGAGAASPPPFIDNRQKLSGRSDGDRRSFAVVKGGRGRRKVAKIFVFCVGHSGERHNSVCHEAMQKVVLAVPAACLVLQLSSHDLRNDHIVGDGRKDALAIFASMKVDQNARVENQRIHDINQGA